jgi:ADP-heptose:LPS heptosyltransferase
MHPGAAAGARRWPLERWTEVAFAERDAGRVVAITGSAAERPLAERLARAAGIPRSQVLAGRTTLPQLAAAVAVADRVACTDTGVAHLATAYGTPSVVLFGPTSSRRWGPPLRPLHRVLWAGGVGDPHADAVDSGLLGISAAAVCEALDTLASRTVESRAVIGPAVPQPRRATPAAPPATAGRGWR